MTTPNQTETRALKFAGVAVYVDDVRLVLDFYHRAFGFRTRFFDEAFDYGELDAGETGVAFASHKTGEMLMPGRFVQPQSGQPSTVEFAFFTSDVPAAFARAVDAGAVPLAEPKLMPWGMTVAYLRSIEGTLIGLSTPPASVSTATQI